MKKLKILLPVLAVLCVVAFFGIKHINKEEYDGNMVSNGDEFTLEYSKFNGLTYDHNFKMNKGDTIQCDVNSKKGHVDILIEEEDGTRQYKGDSASSGNFSITTVRDCRYIVKVRGENAVGSISFVIDRSKE